MSDREQRTAQNEATAKRMNEQMEGAHGGSAPGRELPMVCECGFDGCEQVIMITVEEYDRLRRDPRRFAVRHEHVIPDVEQVVVETDRYVVTTKRDEAFGDVGSDDEPRQ